MNLAFGCLAFLGVVLIILGRRLIIEDARGFSENWAWAIRVLPLADMMYLARFWDSAKTGAFMSIAGLLLLLPAGGKALWDQKHPKNEEAKSVTLSADERNDLFESIKFEHQERLARKQQKVQTLNARLTAWYQSMESRRPALTNAAPAEVAAFNAEAAAYTAFRAVPIQEAAELAKLQAKRYDFWGAVSDAEYREYKERMENTGRKRKVVRLSEDDDAALRGAPK